MKVTRENVIQRIDEADERQEFLDIYQRTPEQFFEEYSYDEPSIWIDVLNDLGIPTYFCERCREHFTDENGRDEEWPSMHSACAEGWLQEMDAKGWNKRQEWSGFE